jgi:hypothetical protein
MDFIPASKVEPRKADPERYCEVCRGPFARGTTEGRRRFLSRRTCGKRACFGALTAAAMTGNRRARVELPSRDCGVCGAPFDRRPGEDPCEFRRRQTCGVRDCHSELIRRRNRERVGAPMKPRTSGHARDISGPKPSSVQLPPPPKPRPVGWWDLPTREGCPVAAIYREWVARAEGAAPSIPDADEEPALVPLEAAS